MAGFGGKGKRDARKGRSTASCRPDRLRRCIGAGGRKVSEESSSTRQGFTYDADRPWRSVVALASCLTAGVAAVAQQHEIQLHSVGATVGRKWTCTASWALIRRSATVSAESR